MKNSARLALVAFAAVALIGAGCAKKKVAAATAAPAAASAPAPAQGRRQRRLPALNPAPARAASNTPAARYPDAADTARIENCWPELRTPISTTTSTPFAPMP